MLIERLRKRLLEQALRFVEWREDRATAVVCDPRQPRAMRARAHERMGKWMERRHALESAINGGQKAAA